MLLHNSDHKLPNPFSYSKQKMYDVELLLIKSNFANISGDQIQEENNFLNGNKFDMSEFSAL